ncbi:hypothetical protein GCM10008939_10870 [Deinococcus aquiradiocola]|uniref:HTH marR-type domain-containing protein n=2 Tax=Deinococcus aquiradiocola TaxID=393059 RepID=A0A917UM80_9DEIO|nr:hypothetical protein GCM10008939_10870 [Deinococcus aquiradiocola]
MTAWWDLTQAMKLHVAPMLAREHDLEFKDFVGLSAIEAGANYPSLIAARTALTPSAVSRLVDDLARAQLIERRLDEQDSRRVQLNLTPRGEAVLTAARSTMHQLLQQGLTSLDSAQVHLFARTLQHLAVTVRQPPTPPATPEETP